MTLAAAILNVLLALPPWHGDARETGEEREARLAPWAVAIAEASGGDVELAAALVALGTHESHWAEYVTGYRCHEGPRGACDDGRARGPLQVHGWCEGGPSPEREARCAARILRAFQARCWRGAHAGNWALPFAAYGTGGKCFAVNTAHSADVVARAETQQRMVEAVRRELER